MGVQNPENVSDVLLTMAESTLQIVAALFLADLKIKNQAHLLNANSMHAELIKKLELKANVLKIDSQGNVWIDRAGLREFLIAYQTQLATQVSA